MRAYRYIGLAMAAIVLLAAGRAWSFGDDPSHMDKFKVPEGCSACHKGRGAPGTPLLKAPAGKFCYVCHGSDKAYGMAKDVEGEFLKRSRHPVMETGHLHRTAERLPEEDAVAPRHVSCYDCHSTHNSSEERPWAGVPGYDPYFTVKAIAGGPPPGRKYQEARELYQVCYRCHSGSQNLPEGATNKAAEFDPDNRSYHPIEKAGRNTHVPSLVRKLTVNSTITCGGCHGSDDPRGPQGPHGSSYEHLLKARYRVEGGIEGPSAYELCYMCHDRRSILGDESFRKHRTHIVKERASCRACHNSHGSADNEHLIDFDPDIARATNMGEAPTYTTGTSGRPKCYLNCHGVEHNRTGVGGKAWPW